MSNAGLNPQNNNDEDFRRAVVCCSMIQGMTNSLEKGQKAGDATIAGANAKKTSVEIGEPVIGTTASVHQMDIDDKKKEAHRTIVVNGKQVQVKLKNYKEIKMKHDEWKKREGIEDKNKDHDAR